ncbi:MAG TPA: SpoIIE family protein phosphatase [Gaiellaceae bacterium]|nr:SpoIIE family protein phosphatase [Gaiellaceae bacterium]
MALTHSQRELDALAAAGLALANAETLAGALQIVADGAAAAAHADVAIVRADVEGHAAALGVATGSQALAAELARSGFSLDDLPRHDESELVRMPAVVQRTAQRVRASAVLLLPVQVDGRVCGSLELFRAGEPFDDDEARLARLAAGQASLAIRAFRPDAAMGDASRVESRLTLVGDALAAGADDSRTAAELARFAAEGTGASAGLLWRAADGPELALVAAVGDETGAPGARAAAERALAGRASVAVEEVDGMTSAALQLGQPPIGTLQLLFAPGHEPTGDELARLATFGVRAAHALRASIRSRTVALELERTRALLAVVGQAISQLSLAHTLETAVAHVAELLGADRLAVYLLENGRLYAAADVGLAGPHARLAERLLELSLGPYRSRGLLVVGNVAADPRLAAVADASAEAGIEAAVAVPLLAHDDVTGLLAVYPSRGSSLSGNEAALLTALAAQLAVAVQNAQLHERATRLSNERERALEAERAASKQVRALYEISRSFAQSLSLDATLEALTSTIVDVLDVDAAMIRIPDEPREWVLPRALKVADPQLEAAVRPLLFRPKPFGAHSIQRLFRLADPYHLTAEEFPELAPFLERGWTGAAVPIATASEVLASLKIISVRPGAPVTDETLEEAVRIANQAALAIDNARLYQQQKQFTDTMQRSLLPQSVPELAGLEFGAAYESSARVEVGGDVYDFMELSDGRLAVTLGDVTGHGIDAAADMAMAKFVFRSLAREHPEPSDFLQSANDVVVGEIAPGKFITMVYVVIDPGSGAVAVAGAGHPAPRIVRADGSIKPLEARGLVLGVERGQRYEDVHEHLDRGDAVVLYTDGVIEARRDGVQYGNERLDALLTARVSLPPEELAQAVLDDCRAFAEGELADDCAVVVVRSV